MIPDSVRFSEQYAEKAFSKQSEIFDELYDGDAIVAYKRERVRRHVIRNLTPGCNILELNSGTGEDAIYFAQKGYPVHATDISTGMQSVLRKKVAEHGLSNLVTTEICSFTQLDELKNKGPYDLVFSNFAGLNCTGDLDKVLASLAPLVKPGGMVTLVVLPKFCLWETLLIFKGKFKTATRRFFAGEGRVAHIEGGAHIKCWYYNPSYIINGLKSHFTMTEIDGLCAIVPPSYLKNFAEKHPRTFEVLKKLENKFKAWWPFRYVGDYYIISLNKIIPEKAPVPPVK